VLLEECEQLWAANQIVDHHNVGLPHGWHLNCARVQVPAPPAGRKLDAEICRRIRNLPEAVRHEHKYRNRQFWYDFLMKLSKGANSLGLQVQSVVARVKFSHEGTWGLISNSRGTVEKAPLVLLQATCKAISLSCVLKSTEWLLSTRCKCK
jgi:hypothetical protein